MVHHIPEDRFVVGRRRPVRTVVGAVVVRCSIVIVRRHRNHLVVEVVVLRIHPVDRTPGHTAEVVRRSWVVVLLAVVRLLTVVSVSDIYDLFHPKIKKNSP